MKLNVVRSKIRLEPDKSRVLLRPFDPGNATRKAAILGRILNLTEEQVGYLLEEILTSFGQRHEEIRQNFRHRFEQIWEGDAVQLTESRRLFIGSCFLQEYSVESAALFNPSIVPHPDQTGVEKDSLRFILSLRATGEGHISSIGFRTGILRDGRHIKVEPTRGFLREPRQIPNSQYDNGLFRARLVDIGVAGAFTDTILGQLGSHFSLGELKTAIDAGETLWNGEMLEEDRHASRAMWALAKANFEVQFDEGQDISQRILFPATLSQRNGIEDARFVCFQDDNGQCMYYATFTAYDGRAIMPELVETRDFLRFRFLTLNGLAARNKGMALFPRKINGQYAMLGRQDSESISLMYSSNVHFWNHQETLFSPAAPWELIQLGNCGSPIETSVGWLVMSHGVGPLRKYCISASLLDLNDPSKVIGRLKEPLLEANASEREGYVPNVVYSCGAIVQGGELVIPYGMSDSATGFATVKLKDVLEAMTAN